MSGFSIADVFTSAGLAALLQVVMIDLMLAGDNVMVMGTLASRLPLSQRKRVLVIGVGLSMLFLIVFALVATQLLQLVGLLFAGGLLLLWVAWKLWRELSGQSGGHEAAPVEAGTSLWRASLQIVLADLSMSLDNVLAVAGAARDHPAVLLFGLALSVTLMAVAANFIAKIIERYRIIAYAGLLVILYVAGSMIYHGWTDPGIGVGSHIH
jgi:YjbE family integral membrane protein